MNNKKLIVHADDYGVNLNVIKSIIDSNKKGILTSTSIKPLISEDLLNISVKQLNEAPNLDCGIHITLCSCPLTGKIRPLCTDLQKAFKRNGGYFPSVSWNLVKIYNDAKIKKLLTNEIRNQIRRIINKGIEISHINCHYYISEIPFVNKILVSVSEEFEIPAIRVPNEKITLDNFTSIQSLKSFLFLKPFGLINKRVLSKSGLQFCNYYHGSTNSRGLTPSNIVKIFKEIKNGITEFVFHPSLMNSQITNERQQYEFLISSETKRLVDDNNLILTTFKKEFGT